MIDGSSGLSSGFKNDKKYCDYGYTSMSSFVFHFM